MTPAAERSYCPHCSAVFRTPFSRCPLDGSKLSDLTDDPLVGTTLDGRYEVEECIGEGGMGRVYRAKHPRMSRYYAIKVLFGDHAGDTRMRSRFAREAEGVCRLSHPNVISVVDFGETDEGLLYLVMDLAPGRSLAQVIHDEAPLPISRALGILGQLAKGLAHAHDRGLVHRDFKGENVIMVEEDQGEVPKIVDFGICMIVEDSPAASMLTSNGMVMGTPAVMAPEQASGDKVDHRTDLFSLGIVGYQLLSGCLPFEGTPLDMARKNLYEQIPPIAVRSGIQVDPRIEAIISKLTAKKADERYQHANEVLADLEALKWAGTTSADWSVPTPPPTAHTDTAAAALDHGKTVEQISGSAHNLQALPPISTEYISELSGRRKQNRRLLFGGLLVLVGLGAALAFLLLGKGNHKSDSKHALQASAAAATLAAADTNADDGPASAGAAAATTDSDESDDGATDTAPSAADSDAGSGESDGTLDSTGTSPSGEKPPATNSAPDKATSKHAAVHHSTSKHNTGKRNAAAHKAHRGKDPAPAKTDDKLFVDQVKELYRGVGASLDRLERRNGKPGTAALRQDYLDIQYSKIFRGEAEQLKVYNQLRRLSRKIRAAQ